MRPHSLSQLPASGDATIAPDDLDVDVEIREQDDDDTRVTTPMSAVRDEGELYGVHTPAATDTTLPDADHAFATGQNWTEALEERSAEGGPLPEHDIDVVDSDDDRHPHSETKDRPIADLGSGGRGGL
ncbi:MAG TPA: hypothetical protein VGL61_03065 [Kofleriaceae bacterium]|jgi:hypothetical protein